MNTSGYETVLQLRDSFLQRIVDEERQRPNSPFLQTFDEIPPTNIGNVQITETVINVARGTISLETLPADNAIRLGFQAAEAQLTFQIPEAPSTVLYQLVTNVDITGPLDSVTVTDEEAELVQIGIDTNNVIVAAEVTNGHPFDNNAFLLEAINSQLQAAFVSGTFPTQELREEENFVLFTADLFVEAENDVGGDPTRQIRASFAGANQIATIIPIHLRWSNIESTLPLEPSMAIISEIVLTAPLTRQLAVPPAFVQIGYNASIITIQNTQPIEGENSVENPAIEPIIEQTLTLIGQGIADEIGNQRFDTLTLEEINGVVADLIQTTLEANGQLVPFWERSQNQSFQNATPVVLDGVIAIGINAGPEADPAGLENFIPEDQDFSVLVGPDIFLESINTFLHTPNEYRDITSNILVNGGNQTGSELAVDRIADEVNSIQAESFFRIEGGGNYLLTETASVEENAATLILNRDLNTGGIEDNELLYFRSAFVAGEGQSGTTLAIRDLVMPSGTIRERLQITISGVSGIYTVTENAAIENRQATLTITPELSESPEDGARILFTFGFGLPNRRFPAGGNDREIRINNLTPSLHPGFFRLSGPITVLRPNAIVQEIDGSVTIELRLQWIDEVARTARVDGSDQTGNQLTIDSFDNGPTTISAETRFTIQEVTGDYRLTEDVTIEDDAATITFEPALASAPANDRRITFFTGNQTVEQIPLGDPDVDLGNGPAGLLAGIVAGIIAIFTGSLFGALFAVAFILIVELIIEVVSGNQAGEQLSENLSNAPLPDSLTSISVDIESRFNNPIEISEGGVLLSGTATPVSRFFMLDDTQARSGGPYEAVAGTPLQLNGGLVADDTDYSWFPGDSFTELTERTPTYTYGSLGYQIAALETFNRQFESGEVVRNRHLALVRVRNTVPEISPVTPISGLEGEEIEITAQFTDRSWLDTHTAYVLFGDRTAPVIATVTETNEPPAAIGTLTARHTYCDNGQFTITIKVIDVQGGSQTAETTATIQNVPPVVEAGPDQFAYPCTPTRLVGHFEDQGWCDTHTAIWNFGDCSPLLSATVEETNEPPKAVGTATGTHCYTSCGTFVAELTVTDDDDGVGTDYLIIRSIDLLNGNFEGGFYQVLLGQVANHWQPYFQGDAVLTNGEEIFFCEHCLVYDGVRSQGINSQGQTAAGIFQTLGANFGWEYQFSASVHISPQSGTVRLGIDPTGQTNPEAETVLWSETSTASQWTPITVRATATAATVTVFLEARNLRSPSAHFDSVSLKVYPCPPKPDRPPKDCPPPEKPPKEPPTTKQQCVDWNQVDPLPPVDIQMTVDGLTFLSQDGEVLRIVQYGQPEGQTKLAIPNPNGLRIIWTEPVIEVEALVSGFPDEPINMRAFNSEGLAVGADTSSQSPDGLRTLTIQATDITVVEIRGGIRGTLSRICLTR